jgi:hypothetical protein
LSIEEFGRIADVFYEKMKNGAVSLKKCF